eukprot:6143276-Amphidinium_carterae.1
MTVIVVAAVVRASNCNSKQIDTIDLTTLKGINICKMDAANLFVVPWPQLAYICFYLLLQFLLLVVCLDFWGHYTVWMEIACIANAILSSEPIPACRHACYVQALCWPINGQSADRGPPKLKCT